MNIQRIAAFSDGAVGGNPAGVVLGDTMPQAADMQRVAGEVGFSETAFAVPNGEGKGWRVRYFSPEAEVPFCGHATIALGAALAMRHGDGVYPLQLNHGTISVEGRRDGERYAAALQSPPTRSEPLSPRALAEALSLFGLGEEDLHPEVPPACIHAGADHLLLMLKSRDTLAAMRYGFARGQQVARSHGWVTMLLCHAETPQLLHTRNAFAYGGVYEDPATGASTAALAGYLRELGWPHGGHIELRQGDDMGVPCRLRADITPEPGASIRVSGVARVMRD
ncbi:MAG: PhzF family phenazine biosynthesis protein [Pseudomonadota bacterium]